MVMLVQKLGHSVKFPSRTKDRRRKSALVDSLHNFRSKISSFIATFTAEIPSLAEINKCFVLIKVMNRAFAELVDEIEYPVTCWGGGAAEEYFNYSMLILDLLNSITSAASRLRRARVSVIRAPSPIKNSRNPADGIIKMIAAKNCYKGPEYESEKERVVLQAMLLTREMAVLALGLVLSGFCGDNKVYLEIRKSVVALNDPLVKGLDLKFCKWIRDGVGVMEKVEDVNNAIEGFSAHSMNKLQMKLRTLENGILGIEQEVDSMFSEVLCTRNKLLDNYRKSLN